MSISDKVIKLLFSKNDAHKIVASTMNKDFIPYVCHYNENTILTKNGELMQIIRVTGFHAESFASDIVPLREEIRESIAKRIKGDTKFAFWLHTIRRNKDLRSKKRSSSLFANYLDEEWSKENDLDQQYVNEFYISIIIEGFDTSITNFDSFIRSFSFKSTNKFHIQYLEKSAEELNNVVNNILEDIAIYGSKKLGIAEWDGLLYSEPMRFFGKILNLYEDRYLLSDSDLSEDLSTHRIAFGDREIEVAGNNNKNFAAILSIKEYREVSLSHLDKLLQSPIEFIISQSCDFTTIEKDLEEYRYQDYILGISQDEEFREIGGIKDFFDGDTDGKAIYGKVQTSIMIIAKNLKSLQNDVIKITEILGKMGFVAVREEVFLEHCFWAQLPCNFTMLRRQKPLNINLIAGFAALHSFPTGSMAGNHWGSYVSLIKTILDTPYFFNFHDGNIGNTIFFGDNDTAKSMVANFLMMQSCRFDPQILYLDFGKNGKAPIGAINGKYYDFPKERLKELQFGFDPIFTINNIAKESFSYDDKVNFLINFFNIAIAFTKEPISQNELSLIPFFIKKIIDNKIANFRDAIAIFNTPESRNIYKNLRIWLSDKLSNIFNIDQQPIIDFKEDVIAIETSDLAKKEPIFLPILIYLLSSFEAKMSDDRPSIIVIHNALEIIGSSYIYDYIKSFIGNIHKKNGIILFLVDNNDQILDKKIIKDIQQTTATELYFSNTANPSYNKIFELDSDEVEILEHIDSEDGQFLHKHAQNSIISTIEFKKNPEIMEILLSTPESILAIEEVLFSLMKNNDENKDIMNSPEWIEEALAILKEINKQKKQALLEKLKQEKINEKERQRLIED